MKMPRLRASIFLTVFLLASPGLRAEGETTQEVADRYESLLARSPQSGTALDRVIEWYRTGGGGLEALQKRWKEHAAEGQADRRSYLILLGLLAERQRETDEARAYYQEALKLEGEKALAARPLAALETTEGNFTAAAAAYTDALSAKTLKPADRLELMRALALLYQRAFDSDKALAVWRDAVEKFGDDPFVLEEAGEAFLAAADYADARKSFLKLREQSAGDAFRQIAASLRLARTAELEGKTDETVDIYAKALDETSGGSWINREVRSQIEALHRRKDDLPGLLGFYEKRMQAAPQDYLTLVAKAAVLEDLGRANDAIEATRAAAKLAPDNLDLRLALIRRLQAQNQTAEALAEAAALGKAPDAPVRVLALLGDLHWAQYEQTKDAKARAEALAAWRRIAPDDARDPSRIAQLADILTARGLPDEAAAQWQRIVALTPDQPEARQRLAEIYLKKQDRKSAVEILAPLAEGAGAQASNFVTLARIQERLELDDLARETARRGLDRFANNFDLLSLAWRQAVDAKDAGAVAKLYPALWTAAPGDFLSADVEKKYAVFLDSSTAGKDALDRLSAQLAQGPLAPPDAALLFRLALSRRDEDIARRTLAAIQAANNPVRSARAGYDLAQTFGGADEQVAALEAVAAADPRLAGESLRQAARIQADSGQLETAIKTLTGLLERSPNDVSLYTTYADFAVRAGRAGEAAARLRKAITFVDDATTLRLQLASLLDLQGRGADAAKVLQEAFENEPAEGRRMEVFRRQIEQAARTGTIDDLIASLREKQAREQGGARYGTYLAEIFMAQNDFLAAREELTRSLGRTPDNAAAVSRLMDLADRGGDQEEGIRLAKKLAELAPSAANRAAYLTRLFDNGEREAALAELERARPEIPKDPAAWSTLLASVRKAGMQDEADAIVGEIAASAGSGVLQTAQIARLRLMQRDYDAAEKALWETLEAGDLAASLAAVAQDTPPRTGLRLPEYWMAMQPFQMLANDAQTSLQQMYLSYRGYYPTFRAGVPGSAKATPEQREQARALYLLALLADARQENSAFLDRLKKLLAEHNASRKLRFLALRSVNDFAGSNAVAQEQVDDPKGDIETDRFLLGVLRASPAAKDQADALRDRVRRSDPKADFEFALEKAQADWAKNRPKAATASQRAEAHRQLEALRQHPGYSQTPLAAARLASLAATMGDYSLAFQLCAEAGNAGAQKEPALAASAESLVKAARLAAIAKAIQQNDPVAASELDLLAKTPAKSSSASSFFYGPYGVSFSRGVNPLTQASFDLVAGDSQFPVGAFRALSPQGGDAAQAEKVRQWFAEHATGGLSVFTIGAFYADWFAGRREEAIRRLEALQAKHPTPRTAALLFEAYERGKEPAKALALADQAGLQEGETNDLRALRVIRLLRASGKADDARAAAERLARGRVSYGVRDQLLNELNILGVPPAKYAGLSTSTMGRSRSTRDRGEQLRLQVEKLIAEKKTDEAGRIALQALARSLPTAQDYQEINARWNMINALRRMDRINGLRASLQDKLDQDPGDFDTLVRLIEIDMMDEDRSNGERIAEFLQKNPRPSPSLAYAVQLLRRRGDSRSALSGVAIALLKTNPEALANTGLQLTEFMDFSSDPKAGAAVAEVLAAMSPGDYNRLFLPSRLTRDMAEINLAAQLAEFAAQAGRPDQAVTLLRRVRDECAQNLDNGLPSLLRLAELQIEAGDQAGATETMNFLLENPAPRSNAFVNGEQSFGAILANLLYNRRNLGADLIRRVARIATATGTLDRLMASLDAPGTAVNGATPALLVRTLLKRPEAAKEWRKIVQAGNTPAGLMPPQVTPIVIELLASQEDAKKLLPAFLRQVTGQQNSYAEGALSALAGTLPTLKKFSGDAAVKRFVASLVAQVLADPNGPRYLLFSESYSGAVNALLDADFRDEAQQLFDATAGERNSRAYANQPVFRAIEQRLATSPAAATNIDVLCAGLPSGPGRLRIRWKATLQPVGDDDGVDFPAFAPGWNNAKMEIPKNLRPVELEIHAGPNPAALERVAHVARPGSEGIVEAKVPPGAGLLQARWKLADGSTGAGSLFAYLSGENLIPSNGVPDAKGGQVEAFKTGQPGPLGEKSAVLYQAMLPTPQTTVPLATIDVSEPGAYAFSGWFQTGSRGNAPRLEVRLVRENGRTDRSGSYFRPAPSGQWAQSFQTWSSGDSYNWGSFSIDKTVRKIILGIALNANNGYNAQWSVEGAWDGLQFVRLKAPAGREDVEKARAAYRGAMAKKDYPAAAGAFLALLKLDPYSALEQSPSTLVEVFKNAKRFGQLFTEVSAPAFFLPNPLRSNQPVLRNSGLIDILVREAGAPEAPPEAKKWLAQLTSMPLPENLRFILAAAALRQAAATDPAKASAAEILAVLGLRPNAVNTDRVRQLWNFGDSAKPTLALLALLDDGKKAAEALKLIKAMNPPAEILASRQMLKAWLLAPSDPVAALDLWNEAITARYGGSGGATSDTAADRALLLRIARRHPKPGDVIAAANTWMAKFRSPDDEASRRLLVELLYDAAKSDSPQRDTYALLWADAEVAALKSPGYNASRDRLRELASRLMAAAEWNRLDDLLNIAKTNKRLGNDPIQREFEQLRDLVSFARGNLDRAWPVAWYKPAGDGRVTVNWQWNTKDIVPDKGDFDTAASIAAKPLLPEINGQQAIEVLFGEMPGEMTPVGKVEGTAAQGSLTTKLPAANGFLRAVAVFDGKRVSGPLMPVISGHPVYPAAGMGLKDLLTSGAEPLAPELLADGGTAPDGSPAVRIGQATDRRRLSYTGPAFPVTPGKFYVLRAWVRRAGTGSVSMGSEFRAGKNSRRGPLYMILCDRQETTGQWVCYARAVPALSQHTFWIPVDEVETTTPLLRDLDPGTEIAAWDFVEVDHWKYSDWITELANLRRDAGDTPDAATLDRAIALASLEPLTSLDYHGDWLGLQLPKAGKEAVLLDLYRKALAAEANPLFARPKLWRLFNNMNAVLNRCDGSPAFRWELANLGLENAARMGTGPRVVFQAHALTLAPTPEKKKELAQAISAEIAAKLADQDRASAYFKDAISARGSRGDRPVSEFLNLILALDDPATTDLILKELQGKRGDSLALSDKILATMALEACRPGAKADEDWPGEVTRAFRATENSDSPGSYMRWTYALADLLASRQIAPEVVMALRKEGLARVLKAKAEDNGRAAEGIRTASFLVETALAQGEPAAATDAVTAIVPVIKENSGKLSEESLRVLLKAVDLLAAANDTEQVASLVTAAEADIRKSPKMTEAWAAYLKPGA